MSFIKWFHGMPALDQCPICLYPAASNLKYIASKDCFILGNSLQGNMAEQRKDSNKNNIGTLNLLMRGLFSQGPLNQLSKIPFGKSRRNERHDI